VLKTICFNHQLLKGFFCFYNCIFVVTMALNCTIVERRASVMHNHKTLGLGEGDR
jgi:hypothetical protein